MPIIDVHRLPDISKPVMDFGDTSFYRSTGNTHVTPKLPLPAVVRQESEAQGRNVVIFEHLNLVAKFGPPCKVRLEEAQILRVIGRLFQAEELPVPEIFSWKVDHGENFIYMSLIKGITLNEGWPLLTQMEKEAISGQLSQIVSSLRRIRQPSPNRCIGSISRGPIQDIYFRGDHEAGPFNTLAEFNNRVQLAAFHRVTMPENVVDPYREYLPDTCNVYFTHADLHLYNIMISDTPHCRKIIGIIDWEQAGWYPEYWESCKMNIAVPYSHEWRECGWGDSITAPYDEQWTAFSEYWMWRRP